MLVPAVYNGKPLSNPDEIRSDSINVAEMENNNHIDQSSEPSASRPVIHRVKNGETLQSLASKYGTSAKNLMKINHLKSAKLKAGQSLTMNAVVSSSGGIKRASYKTNSRVKSSSIKAKSSHAHSKISTKQSGASKHISAKVHHRLK